MKPYVGRFYVLVVVCLLSLHHNSMWVTFSTIPEEASKDFNLSDDQITILAGMSCIHDTRKPTTDTGSLASPHPILDPRETRVHSQVLSCMIHVCCSKMTIQSYLSDMIQA